VPREGFDLDLDLDFDLPSARRVDAGRRGCKRDCFAAAARRVTGLCGWCAGVVSIRRASAERGSVWTRRRRCTPRRCPLPGSAFARPACATQHNRRRCPRP